jgi:hypothetical protein
MTQDLTPAVAVPMASDQEGSDSPVTPSSPPVPNAANPVISSVTSPDIHDKNNNAEEKDSSSPEPSVPDQSHSAAQLQSQADKDKKSPFSIKPEYKTALKDFIVSFRTSRPMHYLHQS